MLLPLLLNLRVLNRSGVGGRVIGKRYALQIDKRWHYFDDPQEIAALVKQEAVEEAQTTLRRKPRARLLVAPGKAVEPSRLAQDTDKLQHQLRQTYRFAYEQAIKAIEQDEDDALIALLT